MHGNHIVAIEQGGVVGVNNAIVCRCADGLFYPVVVFSHHFFFVGESRAYEIHVVVFEQHFKAFVHAGPCLSLWRPHGVDGDVEHRPLASFLPVVYPSYYGHEIVDCYFVVQSVFAVEVDGLWIVLAVEVEGVYQRVFVAKQSPDSLLFVFVVGMCETLFCKFGKLFYESLGDDKILHSVLSWVLVCLFSDHSMFSHGVAHLEGRVDDDAVEAVELFGHHASSRRAYDEVRLVFLAFCFKECDGLLRVEWNVVCHHFCVREQLSQNRHCARLC